MVCRIGPIEIESPFVLAPMVHYTSGPARRIARAFGAGLVHTEMLVADGLVKGSVAYRRKAHFEDVERPIAAQIVSNNPHTAACAATMLADMGYRIVDINMACPALKVLKRSMGGALLTKPAVALRIAEAVSRHAEIVTVKLRLGYAPETPSTVDADFLRRLSDAGVQAVTIHGRFVKQTLKQPADWRRLGELAASSALPVVGSGDIHGAAEAVRMLSELPVCAVAFARGAMGRPWVFRQARDLLAGRPVHAPTGDEIQSVLCRYLTELAGVAWPQYRLSVARRTVPHFLSSLNGSHSMVREVKQVGTAEELDHWAKRWGLTR